MEHVKIEKPVPNDGKSQTIYEYSPVLNDVKIGIIGFLVDEDLTILWVNDFFSKKSGYSQEEYKNAFQTMRQYYAEYPNDFAVIKNCLITAMEREDADMEFMVRMPQRGGDFSWVRVSAAFTEKRLGGHMVCYAVYHDRKKEVESEEESDACSDKHSEYFEWMLDEYVGNAYISDMETYELLYMNKSAQETVGISPEQVVGEKCYKVIQGRESPCPFCTNSCLTEDEFYEWEFFNPMLDRTFMIKDRIVNWKGKRARLELSHDNYSMEYKLAKKDREREAILRTIPGGFFRLDARDMNTILWYGANFLQIIGYTKNQFEKELHNKFSYIHPDDMGHVVNMMQKAKKTGEDIIMEARIITRDGTTKVLTITLSYVSSENSWDDIESIYSVGIDVTNERREQRRQRKVLEDAYQTARVASLAKTNFLSAMSHDIRTPMNAVMGMVAIAQANLDSPEKIKDCLNKINTSGRHLLSLINEVLDMSKIESGKIDLTLERINLPDLIQNITDMCRPLITEKRHKFQINIGQVRHENVIADGDRLQQILLNLLSNAVKYTPEGGMITLEINELPLTTPHKSQYELICTDNGIGISEDFMPFLFEPFSRAEDPRISKLQGTGLGMTITENIVRMMNGTIEVQSKLGEGSVFTVSVPLELCSEEDSNNYSQLEGLSVLIVDDDRNTCENAASLLNEIGMRGCWALSGEEAVSRIEKAHEEKDDFFAVIINWKMSQMSGADIAKAIRGKMGDAAPIIISSSYDHSAMEQEYLNESADAFISKPLFKSKMLQVLELFLSIKKADAEHSKGETESLKPSGKRILLVEDNDINREIVMEILRMKEFVADSAENGQQAVEMFAASVPGEYGMILMDIQMPVLNGYDATVAIRALNRSDAQTIPIFALTADAFASDVLKAHSVGMNGHIAKPINMKQLIETLHKWMN